MMDALVQFKIWENVCKRTDALNTLLLEDVFKLTALTSILATSTVLLPLKISALISSLLAVPLELVKRMSLLSL